MAKTDIKIEFTLDYVRAKKLFMLQEHNRLDTGAMLAKCIDHTFTRTGGNNSPLFSKFQNWLTQTIAKDRTPPKPRVEP